MPRHWKNEMEKLAVFVQEKLWRWRDGGEKTLEEEDSISIGVRRSWSTCAKETGEFSRKISISLPREVAFQIPCETGKSPDFQSVYSILSLRLDTKSHQLCNGLQYQLHYRPEI